MSGKTVTKAFRGEIFHTTDDPASGGPDAVRHLEDGVLEIRDGIVERCVPAGKSELADKAERLDGLIVPGFVDTHVHYPQLGVLASYGTELMEWLNKYTFPHETRFSDPGFCRAEARRFVDEMLRAGTTTALVFATSHKCSADALFEEAHSRNLRLVTGKVLSDREVPDDLRDTPDSALADSQELIDRWHGKGRLGYAVTPRFAVTSTPEQLEVAGRLLKENDGTLLHTHYSESAGEIARVSELFPDARDYLEVYERAGLVGRRTVLAHTIHPSEGEWDRLERSGAALSFCPCSNLFIGSGLFRVAEATRRKIRFGLGSDVGGGTSLSLLGVMDEAYKVARMGKSDIHPFRLWYLATLGGARAMGLGDRIGSFEPGREADFIVVDPKATSLLAERVKESDDIVERLMAIAVLGDDRNVSGVYVMGERQAGAR